MNALKMMTGLTLVTLLCWPIATQALDNEFKRPSTRDIDKGRWKMTQDCDGNGEAEIKVEVTDIRPEEAYQVIVEVTDVDTGEVTRFESPVLMTESR